MSEQNVVQEVIELDISHWTKSMQESEFAKQFNIGKTVSVNGSPMKQAVWNLILSKRDIGMWTRMNMKPTRNWKVSDVKWYFGIKGRGEKLMAEFMVIFDTIVPKEKEEKNG